MENEEKLIKCADNEKNLVWTRFNALLVANAVWLSFVTLWAVSSNGKSSITPIQGLIWSSAGLVLAYVWWLLTSYGWSLLHAYLDEIPNQIEHAVYKRWRSRVWKNRVQDPIWWCTHIVIILFYWSYVLLIFFFLMPYKLSPLWLLCISVAVVLHFLSTLVYAVRILKI